MIQQMSNKITIYGTHTYHINISQYNNMCHTRSSAPYPVQQKRHTVSGRHEPHVTHAALNPMTRTIWSWIMMGPNCRSCSRIVMFVLADCYQVIGQTQTIRLFGPTVILMATTTKKSSCDSARAIFPSSSRGSWRGCYLTCHLLTEVQENGCLGTKSP